MKKVTDIIKAVVNHDDLQSKISELESENKKLREQEQSCLIEKTRVTSDLQNKTQQYNELQNTVETIKTEKINLLEEKNRLACAVENLSKLETESEKFQSLPEDEIIYLTGMSINKKVFHNVYNLISHDIDFDSVFENLIENIEDIDEKKIDKFINGDDSETPPGFPIAKAVAKSIIVGLGLSLAGLHGLGASAMFSGIFATVDSSIESSRKEDVEDQFNSINHTTFINELLSLIVKDKKALLTSLKTTSRNDFFAIFQSNQSDIRGLNTLSSENQLHNNFVLNYSYADKPFYENLFINSVNIKFTDKVLSKISYKDIKSIYDDVYLEHIYDIVISRILKNEFPDILNNNYKGLDIPEKLSKDAIKVFKDGFDNRNLFGIDLLSRFLLHLLINITSVNKEEVILKVFVDSSCINKQFIISGLKDEKKNDKILIERLLTLEKNRIVNFTKEIWEYSSSPVYFQFVDDIDHADLIISSQFLNNSEIYPPNDYLNQHYNYSIRVPVKLFISLPIYLNEDGEQIPTRDIVVPERSVHNAKDNGTMNIYTVGGIEHNRPLMRLVNIHRQQESDKRILGFFDNHFDYIHKINHREESNFFHYFLMGANQLVSGLNSSHYSRFDDKTGNSISTDAKLIYFNITEKQSKFTKNNADLTYHIISIYGFSALASAYATLWTIINIKESLSQIIDIDSGYQNSLAFKALDVTDKNKLDNDVRVFTKRVKFKSMDYMEKRLKEICDKHEPFTYVRLEYLKPKDKRDLIKFMYGSDEKHNLIKAESIVTVEDGSSKTKQEKS